MSVKTRQEERLEILSAFFHELTQMDKDILRLLSEFAICVGILYLTYEGSAPGFLSIPSVTIIMSIDFARMFDAYNTAKQKTNTKATNE